MKRMIMGILVLAAAACDIEQASDVGFGDDTEFRQEPADYEIYSDVDENGEISTVVHCPGHTTNAGGSCSCLTGAAGMMEGERCVVSGCDEMHEGSTCMLPGNGNATLEFMQSNEVNYTYAGFLSLPTRISGTWTLSSDPANDSCECLACSEACTCAPGYLDFAVTMPQPASGRSVMRAEPDPKIQLNGLGGCDN